MKLLKKLDVKKVKKLNTDRVPEVNTLNLKKYGITKEQIERYGK